MKKIVIIIVVIFFVRINCFVPLPKNVAESFGIAITKEISFAQELNNRGILPASNYDLISDYSGNLPLFKLYPQLAHKISYISFADLPTAVEELPELNAELKSGCAGLYIKRDDLTGSCLESEKKLYGGNKVRKLEFLLADAQAHGAQEVITFGCAGSNHTLATAVYANQLGLKCTNFLKPQINSPVVQQNLLLAASSHAKLLYFPDNSTREIGAFTEWLQHYQRTGAYPYVIPTGGSCPIGVLGFVNAALELKEQIDAKLLPTPHSIYVPCGSNGTLAGLALGFQLAGLSIHIMAIATEPHDNLIAYQKEVETLYAQTNTLLHQHDNSIPLLPFPKELITIRYEFAGGDYGMPT